MISDKRGRHFACRVFYCYPWAKKQRLPALVLNRASHRHAHVTGALGDFDTGVLQCGDLFGGCASVSYTHLTLPTSDLV